MIFWANACAAHNTQGEFIAVNGRITTSAFHKEVYSNSNVSEVGKTTLWAIKKRDTFIFVITGKYWLIFVIFSLIYSAGNCGITTH